MQAIRTAAQKHISKTISPVAATLVRYLFGLPFAYLYLILVSQHHLTQIDSATKSFAFTSNFVLYAVLASIAQILASAALIKTFQYRNFAIGTAFAKTEAILTAAIGAIFFGSLLSLSSWLGIFLGVIGTLIISDLKLSREDLWQNPSAVYGIASGVGFALTSLWLREASLSLKLAPTYSAAITLAVMITIQTIICASWLFFKEKKQFLLIHQKRKIAAFIGLTSAIGSIGWFTAMSLYNPAVVKTLGQIEFFFTLLLTYFFFKEQVSKKEYLGMLLLLAGVICIFI